MTTKNFLLFQAGKQGGSGRTLPEELFKPENVGKALTIQNADDDEYVGVTDIRPEFTFSTDVDVDRFSDAYARGAVLVFQDTVVSEGPRPTQTTRRFNLVSEFRTPGRPYVTLKFECVDGETVYKISVTYDLAARSLTFGDIDSYDMLEAVHHDATLDGDGTEANPLKVVGGGGSSGPSTLFKTVADMQAASLNVGDVVETAGFYSVNDGGGAKYQIQSTGTANGMDLISVAGGKIASFMNSGDGVYPEQIGFKKSSTSHDFSIYAQRLITLGHRRILLYSSEYTYNLYTTLRITSPDVQIVGGLGIRSGLSSRIECYASGLALNIEHAEFKLENVYLSNESNQNSGVIGIASFETDEDRYPHFGYKFKNVNVSRFEKGFSLCGSVHWHHTFDDVKVSECRIGLYTENFSHLFKFKHFYTNHCTDNGIYAKSEMYAWTFTDCNFGSVSNAIKLVKWPGASVRFSQVAFVGCSFEYDTNASTINNVSGFLDVGDDIEISISMVACSFSLIRLMPGGLDSPGYPNARAISLGNKSAISFIGCQGAKLVEDEVKLQLVNEQRPPKNYSGSFRAINCYNILRPNFGYAYTNVVHINDDDIDSLTAVKTRASSSIGDCNDFMPAGNGKYAIAEVNSFSGTANLPTGLSGFGLLECFSMVDGTRIMQRLTASNNKIYYRRRAYDSGRWENWGAWYQVSLTAV